MARHETLTSLFNDIADAIRGKTGDSAEIKADDFDTAIEAIPTGGEPTPVSDDYFYMENASTKASCYMSITKTGFTEERGTADLLPNLFYSFDKINWTPYTIGQAITVANKIYWKNESDRFSISPNDYLKLNSSESYKIGGRIGSLINDMTNTKMHQYSFYHLNNNYYLIDASDLKLSSRTENACYQGMFSQCGEFLHGPSVLPAEIANSRCYDSMFYQCAKLEETPDILATELSDYCCNAMFYGCYRLTTAKVPQSYISPTYCFAQMFQNCTQIVNVPAVLPAKELKQSCYQSMFSGCISLTTAPALPSTTLQSNCYSYMFANCSSLTTPPALPATTLQSNCYSYMFQKCTSLTHVPALPATVLQTSCYQYMFEGCTALKVYAEPGEGHMVAWNIPGNGAVSGSTKSQSYMFKNVQTDSAPITWPGVTGAQYTYYTEFDPVE